MGNFNHLPEAKIPLVAEVLFNLLKVDALLEPLGLPLLEDPLAGVLGFTAEP